MRPPREVSAKFGRAVRALRLKRGLTQQELADACGLDIGYVGGIERGQRNPSLGVMHGMAKVLGSTLTKLLATVGI
jgi:transcriptional regulator with XRE-family HTH domain